MDVSVLSLFPLHHTSTPSPLPPVRMSVWQMSEHTRSWPYLEISVTSKVHCAALGVLVTAAFQVVF